MILASRQASRTHSYTISSQTLNPHFRNTFFDQKKMVKKETQEQTLHFSAVPLSVKHFFFFDIQPKNYRTTLYDHKLNPNLHSRNTLFSHVFNQKRVLQEWRFKFERFYAFLYDLIHFYCDFRTLSYGFELNSKFNHYIEILLI